MLASDEQYTNSTLVKVPGRKMDISAQLAWMSYNGNDVIEQCNIYLSIEKSAPLCKINKIKAQRELSLFLIFLWQVLLKHIVGARHQSSGDPERDNQLEEIVDDLDPAEDGEASEETHCSTN